MASVSHLLYLHCSTLVSLPLSTLGTRCDCGEWFPLLPPVLPACARSSPTGLPTYWSLTSTQYTQHASVLAYLG